MQRDAEEPAQRLEKVLEHRALHVHHSRAALGQAKAHGARSIGLCLLSAGVFRGAKPLQEVVEIGVRSVVRTLVADAHTTIDTAVLVGYSSEERQVLRAIGDNHDSAHALGYPVLRVRLLAVLFGGMMAGLGGAYLPLMLTPHWAEGMTAGRGWIALALVVFASWLPWRILVGAVIFGGITIMQHAGQARGWTMPSQFLSMLPYIATIGVLVLISRNRDFALANFPSCLGRVFHIGK